MARALVAGVLSCLLVGGAMGGVLTGTARADSAPMDPADPGTPPTVTADALPTVQIDGVVWSQAVVGTTVYAAGQFSTARPAGAAPGTQLTTRRNLLAYDIRTGALITSFAPDLNAQARVVTASPDGSRIYVGGDFTVANGQTRRHLAAYDTATGRLVPGFAPSVSSSVRALAATNSTVYLGGNFAAVGSFARARLAAVSAANGAVLPWAPVLGTGPTDGNRLPYFDAAGKPIPGTLDKAANARTSTEVLSLVLTGGGSQVVASGRFHTINGVRASGVGAMDAGTGATRPFAIGSMITNQGVNSAVYSLSTDGSAVYGTGYDFYGPGNLEGAFAVEAAGGAVRWIADCRGDSYSSYSNGSALYLATHAHDCSNIGGYPDYNPLVFRYATALSLSAVGRNETVSSLRGNTAFAGQPAPRLLDWFPTMSVGTYTKQNQSGWSVTGNRQYVVYGGEFKNVNGAPQEGLVRYAVTSIAPDRLGPNSAGLTPKVVSLVPGTARVTWTASSDQDNGRLTYRVYRDGGTTPVHTVTQWSNWWDRPGMLFTDRNVPAGTHSYRVTASDATGRTATGATVSATVAAGTAPAPRAYAQAVLGDGAQSYWPLGEASGTTAYDQAGGNDLTVGAGVTLGRAGAVRGDTNTAARTNGTGTGILSTRTPGLTPNTFSVEAWFQTTTTAGGRLIGFSSTTAGESPNFDRHVYMSPSGQLYFGVYTGQLRTVNSAARYNDGAWHHVVASMSPAGMALYVDGVLVGSRADTKAGEPYTGYWRIGGDNTWDGARYFAGQVDEVALYRKALSPDVITNHQQLGSAGRVTNVAPTAASSTSLAGSTATFDGSASSDRDGSIVRHGWDFGDGTTGTGATVAHTYAAPGTYSVTLTVTDDKGATGRRTSLLTVAPATPNAAPAAAFTVGGTGLTAAFDGSGSGDGDGEIRSWAWDFGDGTTGTGATAQHTYAKDGSYTVRLTVTDDDGATGSTTRTATVAAPTASTALASDAFGRTVSGGLGTADTGGPWTAQAGATRQSVAPGTATMQLPTAGTNTGSHLAGVLQTSGDLRTSVSLSAAPTGGGTYVYVTGRRVGVNQEYRARLRFLADGRVAVGVTRLAGSATETLIGSEVLVPGLVYRVGTPLEVRLQVSGTGTTDLKATVWPAGSVEPATPTVVRTDTTASLQSPGGIGLAAYLTGSSTSPVAVRFSKLTVVPVGPAPAPNAAPTARFTSTAADLVATLDGSGSTDPDGTVAAHAWEFGDGTRGTGAKASHTYATAGTYQVTLTVTDDDGATARVTQPVTVTAPAPAPAPGVVASDAFDRTVSGGLGTADVGGAWTAQAGATRQSVAPGTATMQLPTAGTNTGSHLAGVSQTRTDLRTSVSLSAAPTGGGTYVHVTGRRVAVNQEYRARLRFLADGRVAVGITRLAGTATEALVGTEVLVPGLTYRPGDVLQVRLRVTGTGTTDLAATVWAGATEPTAPTLTRTDTTASLQAAGGIGLAAYLTGSSTAPVAVRFGPVTATVVP